LDDPSVISAWDLLKEDRVLGKEVAVIGGGAVGLETAVFVAAKGTITPEILHFLFAYEAETTERLREIMFKGTSRVTVFEMLPKAGTDVGRSTKWVLFDNLNRYGVNIIVNAKVTGVENGKVEYDQDGQTHTMQFDNVILSSGSKSVRSLSDKLEELGIPFSSIGDGVKPGKIDSAIHGGFLAAINI
jgi:2,4-dienoyl-CoA reductase (NADPH2)